MDDKLLIAVIGAGAALIAVGLKNGYDYWREKSKESNDEIKLWKDLLFRLIQLHTEVVKMKNSLKSHKDIEKVRSESLVVEIDTLGNHLEECLSAVAKIDPVLASQFNVKLSIKLLRLLANGFREEKKTEEEKKQTQRRSNKRLSVIQLRKRILGLDNKLIKIRKELNKNLDDFIEYGLPLEIFIIKFLLNITSEKLGGKFQKQIAREYPYSFDEGQELIKLNNSFKQHISSNRIKN